MATAIIQHSVTRTNLYEDFVNCFYSLIRMTDVENHWGTGLAKVVTWASCSVSTRFDSCVSRR